MLTKNNGIEDWVKRGDLQNMCNETVSDNVQLRY